MERLLVKSQFILTKQAFHTFIYYYKIDFFIMLKNKLFSKSKPHAFLAVLSLVLQLSSGVAFAQDSNPKDFDAIKKIIFVDLAKGSKLTDEFNQKAFESKNDRMIAQGNYLNGLINYFETRHYISNTYYTQALKTRYARENMNFTGNCYNNMGINYEILNMYPEAIKSYMHSLRFAEKIGDSTSINQSKINIGLLNLKIKRYDVSLATTKEALRYFKRIKDSVNLSLCYQNIAVLYSDLRKYDVAIEYAEKSLQISLKNKNTFQVANDYYNISNNYALNGNIEKSDYYIQFAKELIPKIGNREGLSARIYLQIGNNEKIKGNYALAEYYLLKSLDIVKSLDLSEGIRYSYEGVIDLYAKSGEYEKYGLYQDEMKEFEELEKNRQSIERVQELQTLYEFDQKSAKIEKQNQELAAKQNQILVLTIFISIVIGILIYLFVIHIRMKRYMRSLFEQKLEQTKQEEIALMIHTSSEVTPQKNLHELYNQIIAFINGRNIQAIPDLKIAEISAYLKVTENEVTKAIETFGNKDVESFLCTHYIDEICKEIIKKGKAVNVREMIAPNFENYAIFYKKFKDITGLTPEQFITYSQEKIDLEKQDNS